MRHFAFSHFWSISLFIQGNIAEDENPNICDPSCQTGWEKSDGHCFLWQKESKTWVNAEKFCNEKAGHLASVKDLNIHNYLWSKIEATGKSYWIGGTLSLPQRRWQWSDGSPWNFTHWTSNSPSEQGEKYCVLMYRNWWDVQCELFQRFACSRPICPDPVIVNNENFQVNEVTLAIIVTVTELAFIICVAYKFLKKNENEEVDVDENTVYGVYQLGELYERQYSTNEVVDNNFYYE